MRQGDASGGQRGREGKEGKDAKLASKLVFDTSTGRQSSLPALPALPRTHTLKPSSPSALIPHTVPDRYRQLFEQNTAVQLVVRAASGEIAEAN